MHDYQPVNGARSRSSLTVSTLRACSLLPVVIAGRELPCMCLYIRNETERGETNVDATHTILAENELRFDLAFACTF